MGGATRAAWKPQHLVVGGSELDTERETTEAEREDLMNLTLQIAGSRQRGYAPEKYSGIAKSKVVGGDPENHVHIMKQFLEQRWRQYGGREQRMGHCRAEPGAREET